MSHAVRHARDLRAGHGVGGVGSAMAYVFGLPCGVHTHLRGTSDQVGGSAGPPHRGRTQSETALVPTGEATGDVPWPSDNQRGGS